ncbi:MAG: GMC family oxidoreductase [Pseudomonadota bacterium]
MKIETDIVVIGSGAGGATLAMDLAGAGRDVVLVEKGGDATWPLGKPLSLLTLYDHSAMPPFFPTTKEGMVALRGICTGGCTTIFGGNACIPPPWIRQECGMDLDDDVQAAIRETGAGVPPEDTIEKWSTAVRFREAAGDMGLEVEPLMKFLYPGKCLPECDHCAFGCERGARWSAREFVKKAAQKGARILVQTEVTQIIIDRGRAVGVKAQGRDGQVDILADKVVCSAGGLGTPVILQRSGIREAGKGLSVDPSGGVGGITKQSWGPGGTFSIGYEKEMETGGFMISNAGGGIVSWIRLALKPVDTILHPGTFSKVLALFVKIADSSTGSVHEDGSVEKPITARDEQRMNRGMELCERILVRAGCDPNSLFRTPLNRSVASHYCGTAAIDRVVDRNLETRITNLFVCDTSVLPRAPGRPPALTAVAMAKWFSRRL